MKYKIGIYIRVSTDEQAQVLDGSLDNQRHSITAFLNLKNQDNDWGELIETFVDDGYSAGDTKRPAYQKMLKAIESKAITLILISDLSRLSRKMADFCDFYKLLEKHNASFISIKEQFDTSTSFGEMMIFNLINLAQFERRQTSERILMNFHLRALRGLINGGSPLLGFDRDPTHSGKRTINQSEANLVRRIFKMYDQGQSFSFIRDQLNSERAARKMSTSEHWNCHAIQTILKNSAFIGMREVNPQNKNKDQDTLKPYQKYQLTSATWPAIISKKLFKRVQNRIEEAYKKERKRYDKAKQRFFLLSGKLRCKECLRSLVGQSAHGKSKVYRYYGHQNPSGKRITCSIKRYSADRIEALISEHLSKLEWQPYTLSMYKKSIANGIPHLQKRLFGQLILDMIIDGSGIHLWYRKTEKIENFRVAGEPPNGEHHDITKFWCSPIDAIGGREVTTNEPLYSHDFIELFPRTPSRIYEECAPLYESGLSIRDIEERTGIPKSTVRETLKKNGMALRNPLNGNAIHKDRLHTKRGGHTPYGYAYLDGQLLIDPKEQIIVRKIMKLHQSGLSGNAIAKELNRQKIPSRTGKSWSPCVVRRIIKLNQSNQQSNRRIK